MKSPLRKRRENGVALYLTTVMMVLIIPTIGLTIDSGMLYAIKCGLQGAVDGAALAAARGLSRGTSSSGIYSTAALLKSINDARTG